MYNISRNNNTKPVSEPCLISLLIPTLLGLPGMGQMTADYWITTFRHSTWHKKEAEQKCAG